MSIGRRETHAFPAPTSFRNQLEKLQARSKDEEVFHRRCVSDSSKIHRLEKRLYKAKTVINELTADLDLRREEQIHIPEQSPKRCATPPRHIAKAEAPHNAQRKFLFDAALASAREEMAGLRTDLQAAGRLKQPSQRKTKENTQLQAKISTLESHYADVHQLHRRRLGDRVRVHRLEQQLKEAKAVVELLRKELDLRQNGKFLTSDSTPKSSRPSPSTTRTGGSISHEAFAGWSPA
ncbi:hypothetical protein Efla_004048 [Eimeria flavescens]